MKELIGKKCKCIFNCENWPIQGYPAFVTVLAVDMPMIKMWDSYTTQCAIWINCNIIERIEEM